MPARSSTSLVSSFPKAIRQRYNSGSFFCVLQRQHESYETALLRFGRNGGFRSGADADYGRVDIRGWHKATAGYIKQLFHFRIVFQHHSERRIIFRSGPIPNLAATSFASSLRLIQKEDGFQQLHDGRRGNIIRQIDTAQMRLPLSHNRQEAL